MPEGLTCGLCGHVMTFERCGFAGTSEGGRSVPLCHADDHDCYRAWTVYRVRPDHLQPPAWAPVEVQESAQLAREKAAFDELVRLGQEIEQGE